MADADQCWLGVVVVTHNSARWLPDLFGSLDKAVAGSLRERGVRIVVADSGSTDDTVKTAREIVPTATLLECGNIGYGSAANRGAKACGDVEWLMICNPDLTFHENFFAEFEELLPVACVAPRLLNEDGTVQPSVGRFPSLRGLIADRFRPREQRKYIAPQPSVAGAVDWVSGACLLVRRKPFEVVGGFDEKYFLYVEEVDLMKRFNQKLYETWYAPNAQVVHHAPNASRAPRPEVQRWAARGLLRYFAKFGGWFALRGYGTLAVLSGRLPFGEAFVSRAMIVERSTGD